MDPGSGRTKCSSHCPVKGSAGKHGMNKQLHQHEVWLLKSICSACRLCGQPHPRLFVSKSCDKVLHSHPVRFHLRTQDQRSWVTLQSCPALAYRGDLSWDRKSLTSSIAVTAPSLSPWHVTATRQMHFLQWSLSSLRKEILETAFCFVLPKFSHFGEIACNKLLSSIMAVIEIILAPVPVDLCHMPTQSKNRCPLQWENWGENKLTMVTLRLYNITSRVRTWMARSEGKTQSSAVPGLSQ